MRLSCVYNISLDDTERNLYVDNFNLPPGYNTGVIRVLLALPTNYPESPPGVGSSRVFVPSMLRYNNKVPKDFHRDVGPPGWSWWCYESIAWNSSSDDLITFFELLRAHMTKPPTRG
ncbi:E2/UBC family protein [Limihaloglobus sulfuriphilus]|nr:E2/UBC family protein [Limihaloglobus sulfuriphilus]